MMLSLDTAYRSFGGEVEASSTPTICRLSDSRRHQLWAIALLRAIRRRGRSRHLAVLAQPVQGLMLTEAAQFEMADFKDRCRNFCGKSTSHEQWPANILAEEFQPAEDVDVAPDGGEVEAIARANIAVCGITIVQSNIDGNMLLDLGR